MRRLALVALVACNGDLGYREPDRDGSAPEDPCIVAARTGSPAGCELWPVDLDNAVTAQGDAAAQPFGLLVTNPQADLEAHVTVDVDDASPGEPARLRTIATATVPPGEVAVLRLPAREVDGSPPDVPNGGTGTALGRRAFRLRADVPVVAVQANPLATDGVFSSDASLLLPPAALGESAYVVAGWPQTVARTSLPDTNAGQDLRAFLAIVGTAADTRVHLKTMARVVPGGPFAGGLEAGADADVTLQPFEVLNLETGDFGADFTGSLVTASAPIAVFTGSEASHAPYFTSLRTRSCCANHLEAQLPPRGGAGLHYVVSHLPSRTRALAASGVDIASFPEPTLHRIVAASSARTTVKTTLGAPWDIFVLPAEGASLTLSAVEDFELVADAPVLVASVAVGHEAAGVASGLRGGDPAFAILPPVERWRRETVVVTPNTYAFDYLVLTAPAAAALTLDGAAPAGCEIGENGAYRAYRCPLTWAGAHRVLASEPVSVVAYGFDADVSYAYAALSGTSSERASTR